ncbi:MAG: gliding motility-associated C-terminal domain-containing protein [Bacteroidetes bacterium]|nr:gliding motility-associated C-terminal domain-containing protein [Bacteroidota bacterium]
MMRKIVLTCLLVCLTAYVAVAQCTTTNITGNFSPANGDTLQGIYNITGNFTIGPGITVHVRPFSQNSCGSLEIYAGGNIFISGTINANGAGNVGGLPGTAGLANNINNIEQCSSPTDQCADIFTFGGGAGGNAFGSGAGLGGLVGQNGSGRKDRCLNFGDEGGRVGGAGGAGAGAGGSYGGAGTAGAGGGNGSVPTMSTSDVGCTSTPIVAGSGTVGGAPGTSFGTANGADIALGAGGAGAGGGGRGRTAGTAGGAGGAGGGLVKLVSTGTFTFSGTINANGRNGLSGGNGGNAGASSRCCVDACSGVDEYTHTGAGGGGGGAGGGSGGGVLLESGGAATIMGTINAIGGTGAPGGTAGNGYNMNQNCIFGNSNASAGPSAAGGFGGGGSGGRIKVFFNPCANGNNVVPTMTVTGGAGNAGPAQAGTTFAGAQNGLALGTATPALQSICFNGDPGNLNCLPASGGLGGYTYQWQSQLDCQGPWTNIPGANALNFDPPSGLQDTTCYRLQVQSGQCTTFSDTLRVDVNPALSVTVNPAGPVVACLGDSVTLTTSGGAGATYQWFYNGSLINLATDSFYVATASGSYTVLTQFLIGCDGLSAPVVATFSPPPAAFAIVTGDSIYCPGHPVDLLAVGNGNFQWLLNGTPIPGATNANLNAVAGGNYSVAVTIPGGCTATSAVVTVTNGLVPNALLNLTGSAVYCASDSSLLEASGGGTYAWMLDSMPIFGLVDSNLYVHASGIYQVIVTSADGCADTTAGIAIQVDPTPDAVLSTAGLPVTCTGDSVVFYAAGVGTYQWLYNGSLLPDTTPYYHAGITGDYTLIVTNSAGCSDTSLTYAFSYYPPINTTVNVSGPAYICPGDTAVVQAIGLGSVGWTWLQNDTLVPGANGASLAVTEPGAYSAIAFDQHGCEYPSVLVMVYPGQDPDAGLILIGEPPLCAGETVVLIASGGESYAWIQDSLVVPGFLDSVFVVTQAGDYQVIASTGCGADTTNIVHVEAGIAPTAGIAYDNYPQSLVQLRDQSISAAQWLWTFGDGSSSTEQNPLHQYPNPGDYPVTLIVWDIFGCSDTLSMLISVTDPDFFIPNVFSPNGDGINDVPMTNFRKLDAFVFSIYDRWGHMVFQTNTQDTWWDGKIKGNDAPDGVYFYYLEGKLPQDREAEQRGPLTLVR